MGELQLTHRIYMVWQCTTIASNNKITETQIKPAESWLQERALPQIA